MDRNVNFNKIKQETLVVPHMKTMQELNLDSEGQISISAKKELKALHQKEEISELDQKVNYFVKEFWAKGKADWDSLAPDKQENLKGFLDSYSIDELKQLRLGLAVGNQEGLTRRINDFIEGYKPQNLLQYKDNFQHTIKLLEKIAKHQELAQINILKPLNDKYIYAPETFFDYVSSFANNNLPNNYLKAVKELLPEDCEVSVLFTLPISINKHCHMIELFREANNQARLIYLDNESNLKDPFLGERKPRNKNIIKDIRIDLNSGEYRVANKGNNIPVPIENIFKQLDRVLSGDSSGGRGPVIEDEDDQKHYVLEEGLAANYLKALAHLRGMVAREALL